MNKATHALCFISIDSVMLLEAGFDVVSSDASDKMLKSAYEERWQRRKEPIFDKWSECGTLKTVDPLGINISAGFY